MNGKKAKLLRRYAEQQGLYKKEADLRVGNKVKRMVHVADENGTPKLVEVERTTAVNASRVGYRRLKQAYKNGELDLKWKKQ